MRQSFFDGLQKTFWDNGDKSANKDHVYKLYKLKNNKLKEQNYSIDLKLLLLKKIKFSKGINQILKSFSLIITTYKTIDEQQSKILVKQPIIGFEFYRNQRILQIFTHDQEIHKELDSIFQKLCVLNDFHEKYDCIKVIGNGAFGQVFQAKRKDSSNQYAVKGYQKTYLNKQPKLLQGLSNEILVMKQLDYPSLLKLEEVYESKNSIYLIFEFHNGGHLLDRFQQKSKNQAPRLGQKIVNQIMKNLVSAMRYMHSMNIMHRNIKPENVIFRNQLDHTDVIITEFGYADNIKKPKMIYKRCGTPGFVAPEVLSYRVGDVFYNEQCDVFSLGTIFYVLLTGSNPFSSDDQEQLIEQNIACDIQFDHPALQNRPEITMNLLMQMLDASAKQRITLDDVLIHPYFQLEFQSQFSQINTLGGRYSSYFKQESKLNTRKVGSFDTSAQFLTMQRLPIGSSFSQEGSPPLSGAISTNDIFQKEENFLGYDSLQKLKNDSENINVRKSSIEDATLQNKLKKSLFLKSSLHQHKSSLHQPIQKNLERTLTDEMQDFQDDHNISQMMSNMHNYQTQNPSDRNSEISSQDLHSAQNMDVMNFSDLLKSLQNVETSSYAILTRKLNSSPP